MERDRVRQVVKGLLGRDSSRMSRREFGGTVTDVAIGATVAAVCTSVLARLVLDKENSPKSLNGLLVAGTEGYYETQNLAGGPFPVYKKRDETKQLGVSFPDKRVRARAFLGPTYASNAKYASYQAEDGRKYGWWYQVDAIPIYEQTESGEYVYKDVVQGGWLKIDFLTRVREGSDNLSDAQ